MTISWNDPCVRLTGRWTRLAADNTDTHIFTHPTSAYTTTTAPGSYFELAFVGRLAVLQFDLNYCMQPAPHLWISVDDGAKVEVPVDRFLRVAADSDGQHIVKVLYKGGMEQQHRWYHPLNGAISFIGAQADAAGVLPKDNRLLIEFIGDSITEGVLTDADFCDTPIYSIDQFHRPYQDDNSATYGALTAERLRLRAMFQAYGAVGMTRSGCGGVPRAGLIYPYVCEGVPYTGEKPDIVVINHGANDRAASAEEYILRYGEFLDMVRKNTPNAIVVALSAFCGGHEKALETCVETYNRANHCHVHFVSSHGWVPLEPLHPLRDGHRIIADHFTPILKSILESELSR